MSDSLEALPGKAPSKSRSIAVALIGVLLAGIFLYLSLRKVEWLEVKIAIEGCRRMFFLAAVGMGVVSYSLRGLRWRVLLNTQAQLPVVPVVLANFAGYLGNNVLPARAGELIRTELVSARSGLSRAFVLTTALAERLMDVIVLVAAGTIVIRILPREPEWLRRTANPALAIGVIAISVILSVPLLEERWKRWRERSHMQSKWADRIDRVVSQVTLGFRTFHDPGRFFLFLLYTFAVWALDAYGAVVLAHGMSIPMSFEVALLLLVGLGLGSALPSTPGSLGIFQFVAVTVLVPFGFTHSKAIAFILLTQVAGLMVTGALGSIGMLQYRMRRS